jgi:hypothetical protein
MYEAERLLKKERKNTVKDGRTKGKNEDMKRGEERRSREKGKKAD